MLISMQHYVAYFWSWITFVICDLLTNFTLSALQKTFVDIFFKFAWGFDIEKRRGFLVIFSWSPLPRKQSTKSLRKVFENSGQLSRKLFVEARKLLKKFREIRGIFRSKIRVENSKNLGTFRSVPFLTKIFKDSLRAFSCKVRYRNFIDFRKFLKTVLQEASCMNVSLLSFSLARSVPVTEREREHANYVFAKQNCPFTIRNLFSTHKYFKT